MRVFLIGIHYLIFCSKSDEKNFRLNFQAKSQQENQSENRQMEKSVNYMWERKREKDLPNAIE